MEIETWKIRTLERLTVNWFEQQTEVINVVLLNGEYYCIDDPILLEGKKEGEKKVRIRVIAEVSSEEELYKEYFRNIVRAPLNPYALYLLYHKKGYTTGIPKEYMFFIEKNKDLPIAMIERLNEQLIHFKRITTIEPAVLSSIARLLLEAVKYDYDYERLLEELLKFIETWVEASKYAYPDAETLYSGIMTLVLEDYVKKRRKEKEEGEEIEEQEKREERNKDININIIDQKKEVLPIPAIAAVTTTTGDTITNNNNTPANVTINEKSSGRRAKQEQEQEQVKVERTIAFKITYPASKEQFVDRLINKVINSISRVFRRAGLSIQTT